MGIDGNHQANNVTTKKRVHFDNILDEVEFLEQPSPKGENSLLLLLLFINITRAKLPFMPHVPLLGVKKAPGKTSSMYTCEDISGSNV
jgi:hypothetical protein